MHTPRKVVAVLALTHAIPLIACESMPQPRVVTPTPAGAAASPVMAASTPTPARSATDPMGTMSEKDETARLSYETAVTFTRVGDYGRARETCRRVMTELQPETSQAYHAKCQTLLQEIDATLRAKGLQ